MSCVLHRSGQHGSPFDGLMALDSALADAPDALTADLVTPSLLMAGCLRG